MYLNKTATQFPTLKTILGDRTSPARLEVLDANKGECVSTVPVGDIVNLQASPYSSQCTVSIGPTERERKTFLVSPLDGRLIATGKPEAKASFSQDGSRIALSTKTRVWVVDGRTGETLLEEKMHVRGPVALNQDGSLLAVPTLESTQGLDGNTGDHAYLDSKPYLEVFQIDQDRSLARQRSGLENLQYLADGSLLGTEWGSVVKLKPLASSLVERVFSAFRPLRKDWTCAMADCEKIQALAVSPDGARVAAAGANGLGVVDLSSGDALAKAPLQGFLADSELSWSPDGTKLAYDSGQHYAESVSVVSSDELQLLFQLDEQFGNTYQRFRPDGKLVVASELITRDSLKTVTTLDPQSGELSEQRIGGAKNGIALSHQGDVLMIRQPAGVSLELLDPAYWLNLHSQTLDQLRQSDNTPLDLDDRPGYVRQELIEDSSSIHRSGRDLNSERPKLVYDKTRHRDLPGYLPGCSPQAGRSESFQSDGQTLQGRVLEPSEEIDDIFTVDLKTGLLKDLQCQVPAGA